MTESIRTQDPNERQPHDDAFVLVLSLIAVSLCAKTNAVIQDHQGKGGTVSQLCRGDVLLAVNGVPLPAPLEGGDGDLTGHLLWRERVFHREASRSATRASTSTAVDGRSQRSASKCPCLLVVNVHRPGTGKTAFIL
jgi:hypothetical protein